jgi:sulfatase maturation enzyme AslB (radical SAM superfamily)
MKTDNTTWCAMIHGGLELNFKSPQPTVNHCCIRTSRWPIKNQNPWTHQSLEPLRQFNLTNQWDKGCANCESLEKSGAKSLRQGMNQGLHIDTKGPARIDLLFDIGCNLACRTCDTTSSTYWQKHLKEHGLWQQPIFAPKKSQEVIEVLSKIDLSNLQQLVFCGGETLLGTGYWEIVDWLTKNLPTTKQNLTLCFQTNGTQPISPKYFKLIEKFHLVRLHVSLDGIDKRFEYLRWPASWNQVVDNLFQLRETLPSNVMFLIEETVSIFNLWYLDETAQWAKNNFSSNREDDPIIHSLHLAHGIYNIAHCSTTYRDALKNSKLYHMLPPMPIDSDTKIKIMLQQIDKFDLLRGQSFKKVFPEVAEFYLR